MAGVTHPTGARSAGRSISAPSPSTRVASISSTSAAALAGRSCSFTVSVGAGRTGSRTSPGSQLPAEPISIAGYARTLDRVCDLLELDAPLVGGNSLGALVVAELALRFPQRVGALALVGPACLAPADLDSRTVQLALAAGGRIAGSLLRGPNGTVTRPRAQHILFATVLRHPTLIANDTLYELSSGVRQPAAAAALAALRAHDISGELAEIEAPTLVVHGREDVLVPCADAEQIAAMIRGAELLVFEDTGHMPMVERPVTFDDALLRFAATVDPLAQ
jgi:pimeloyl-ACP methyl ester carboxylesterase